MARRLATRYVFNNYTFKEEFVNDAILRAVEVFDNYNPFKYDKPFAYFTLVMWRTFLQRIQKEKQERTKREKLVMVNDIFFLQDGDDCNINKDSIIQDYIFNSYDE
jgi:DNA-directed RNA polymerase specialized sigma24 family protein